ncbi:MAG: alpha/beta hydrolase fold domain-containing protein [Actinobacteria bacterium]|nr:alpha/beta hydrolase fold domain-containing protein [Actinomycetota bacterium]
MVIPLDPEVADALRRRAEAGPRRGAPARGDVLALRAEIDAYLTDTFGALPAAPDVSCEVVELPTSDGGAIEGRWYIRAGEAPGSAVVYLHGGGLFCGTLDNYEPLVRHYVQRTGVPFLSVGYRLAPESPGETPASDSYDALRWTIEHAAQRGVDSTRVAVMGDSGGGGSAAAAAILARERGLGLARQILVYPMLDDRTTTPDPLLAATATWTYDNHVTAWQALLGQDVGSAHVSPIVAPARLEDFDGLAPAYVEVGELDIFRDESIHYAQRLMRAGVSCELHVHPGAPHAHEWVSPEATISKRAIALRLAAVRRV